MSRRCGRTGEETLEVDPADGCPDSVFVEDTPVAFRNVALITRPGAESRRAETAGAEEAVARLGCSVNWGWEPGTLDGGDVLKVGDTICVGRARPADGRTVAVPAFPAGTGGVRGARDAARGGVMLLGGGVMLLGGGKLLMAATAPKAAEPLAGLGHEPVDVDIGESEKLEGGVTRLSVRLRALYA